MSETPNKLNDTHENPFDSILLKTSEQALPFMRHTNHTPNVITSYSFLCGLGSVWCLYQGLVIPFTVLYLLAYFFDCMDGQYARRYGMVSKFGDTYDHLTDIVVTFAIFFVAYKRYSRNHLLVVSCVIAVSGMGMLMHVGCQQLQTKKPNTDRETIDIFKCLCLKKEWIRVTRYLGTGTFTLTLVLVILGLEYFHRKHHYQTGNPK